jgi:hypothetical protein
MQIGWVSPYLPAAAIHLMLKAGVYYITAVGLSLCMIIASGVDT